MMKPDPMYPPWKLSREHGKSVATLIKICLVLAIIFAVAAPLVIAEWNAPLHNPDEEQHHSRHLIVFWW